MAKDGLVRAPGPCEGDARVTDGQQSQRSVHSVQLDRVVAAARILRGVRVPTRETIVLIGLVVAYRVLVDQAYVRIIAAFFGYQDFRAEPMPGRVFASWAILMGLMPLLVRVLRNETLSGSIVSVLALISLVPTTTLIANDPRYPVGFMLLMAAYWSLLLAGSHWVPSVRLFARPLRSHLPHAVLATVLGLTIVFISWRYTGFRLHFGLFDVYDLRTEARGYEVSTLLGYLATAADNVLPVLIAFYIRRKWAILVAALSFIVLLNFGVSATKQVLFLLVFAIASFAVRDGARMNRLVLVGLSLAVVSALVEFTALGTYVVATLSLYRVLFIPSHLHWVHYDFFQTNELLYLTQSALRFFFESPYTENIQFLIGEYYIGDITARANNGLFSDAYMNFGAVGVLLHPIALIAVLKVLDGAAQNLSDGVRFIVTVALSFVFLGLPLPTAMLSAGVGLLVILLTTLPRAPRAAVRGLRGGA